MTEKKVYGGTIIMGLQECIVNLHNGYTSVDWFIKKLKYCLHIFQKFL